MEPEELPESLASHSDLGTLTLDDAVETLSTLAELPLDDLPQELTLSSVQLLEGNSPDRSIQIIKNSFRVVLQYLKSFYKERTNYLLSTNDVASTRTIMHLVGEAAKRVDRQLQRLYGSHAESVTQWSEYRKLQEFYQNRISQRVDENLLGKWILQLTPPKEIELAEKKIRAKKRQFIDLQSVKNDTEYELLFMRQEDGSRYYNPRLLHALRLICDFGDYFGALHPSDPLRHVATWRDHFYQKTAQHVLQESKQVISRYLKEAARFKDQEFVRLMNQSLFALLLAANPENRGFKQSEIEPFKHCTDYFCDFQLFFRAAIRSYDYQKLVTYPPKPSQKAAVATLQIVQKISHVLYCDPEAYRLLKVVINEAVEQESDAHQEGVQKEFWKQSAKDYAKLQTVLKAHPNTLLEKVLSGIENGVYEEFDPWMQHHLPATLFSLNLGEERLRCIQIPCPTHQEYIQKAAISEEFREALRCMLSSTVDNTQRGCLLIDMQDRTSWKEHARCKALEELSRKAPFTNVCTVVGFATNTDFYNQTGAYAQLHATESFFEQFAEELKSEGSGFYFPSDLQKVLFSNFLPTLFSTVHQLFFGGRNTLRREMRMACIDIVYLFLTLRLIDALKPEVFSFISKDGCDINAAWSAQLFMLIKILKQEKESREDLDTLQMLLYAGPFLLRERIMLPIPFERTLRVIQTLSEARDEQGHVKLCSVLNASLQPFYKHPIWQSNIQV